MKRFIVIAGMVGTMVVSTAVGAAADVHGVSQAGCAAPGAASGGIASRHAVDNGRPAAPIPVTASEGRTSGQGGDAPAQGTNC